MVFAYSSHDYYLYAKTRQSKDMSFFFSLTIKQNEWEMEDTGKWEKYHDTKEIWKSMFPQFSNTHSWKFTYESLPSPSIMVRVAPHRVTSALKTTRKIFQKVCVFALEIWKYWRWEIFRTLINWRKREGELNADFTKLVNWWEQ